MPLLRQKLQADRMEAVSLSHADCGGRVSPKEAKKNRMIRVASPLWEDAKAVADARNEYLSEVIRAALVAYVKKHGKELS